MARMPRTPKHASQEQNQPPLRLEWWVPDCLADNPLNWRKHPDKQLSALKDVLAEVGWAGALLYNEHTKRLVDGHARKKISSDKVPVLVGSWSEEQEQRILATLDPLAAMAEADKGALDTLLSEVRTESEAVRALLAGLASGELVPIFDPGELQGLTDPDEIPEPPDEPTSRPGAFQFGNAARPPLPSKKASQQPAQPFVGSRQELVDGPMFSGHHSTRMFLANRTGTSMDVLSRALRKRGVAPCQKLCGDVMISCLRSVLSSLV